MLVFLGGTPTWRLHIRLCKFVQNISINIWSLGSRTDLKLGEESYLFISYNMIISWHYILHGFQIIFKLRDSATQELMSQSKIVLLFLINCVTSLDDTKQTEYDNPRDDYHVIFFWIRSWNSTKICTASFFMSNILQRVATKCVEGLVRSWVPMEFTTSRKYLEVKSLLWLHHADSSLVYMLY